MLMPCKSRSEAGLKVNKLPSLFLGSVIEKSNWSAEPQKRVLFCFLPQSRFRSAQRRHLPSSYLPEDVGDTKGINSQLSVG